jgi:hypothetical protein
VADDFGLMLRTIRQQLLRWVCRGDGQSMIPESAITEALLEDQAPAATTLLSARGGRYNRGIIGKCDPTLQPMIPVGSVVHIDTLQRTISSRNDWTHEFQRPIYFLKAQGAHYCGWCQLDQGSEWLTLIPHPLSPASSRRWKYRTEIENLGRVVAVAIRLAK